MVAQRNPLLAFVLSLLVAGWGLLYVGKYRYALAVAGLLYGGLALAGLLGVWASPLGVYALGAFLALVKFASAVWAQRLAQAADVSPGTVPGTKAHVLYVAAVVALNLALFYPLRASVLGYQLFSIPSRSMAPTLDIGDYFVTATRYSTPKVGDIVVYRWRGIQASKRVAAVAGDTLAIVNGEVINNGHNLGLFFAPALAVTRDFSLNLAPVQVKENHVYLLGDNRDASNDSRFVGQVPVEDLTGRVTGIWYSNTPAKIATTFP